MVVDIENTNEVLNFGKKEQNKLSRLSSDVLSSAKAYDLGDMDDIISDLIAVFDDSTKNKRFNLFRKERSSDLESQVLELAGKLEVSYLNVLNNVHDLEKIVNETSLILEKLQEKRLEGNQFVEAIEGEGKESSDDFEGNVERFKNALHSLEVSSNIATQMIARVQTIITSDKVLVRKIKFTIQNTIPLWKNSMLDKRISDSYATDFVIKELKGVLGNCQKNLKEHELLQENH